MEVQYNFMSHLKLPCRAFTRDSIDMNLVLNGCGTRGSNMDLDISTLCKEAYWSSFFIYRWQTVEWSSWICTNFYKYWIIQMEQRMYRHVISLWQNQYLCCFLCAICQIPQDVMVVFWLSENFILYMDMACCILLGMGYRSHLMFYLCHHFTWVVFINEK